MPEIKQLRKAGFDLLYNSSKWWDFQASWCLEQYQENRKIAPSISFPETHDTTRLIAEVGGNQAVVKQSYFFAAFFSAGLLMPMGFEYGLPAKLDVIHSGPEGWQEKQIDLTDFITQVNRLKHACPILQEEGPIERLTKAGLPVVILAEIFGKSSGSGAWRLSMLLLTRKPASNSIGPNF